MIGFRIITFSPSPNTRKCKAAYNIFEVNEVSIKDVAAERFKKCVRKEKSKQMNWQNISGVAPSTAYSMMDRSRRDISIVTIKKFCDGLDRALGEFFSAPKFANLEQ